MYDHTVKLLSTWQLSTNNCTSSFFSMLSYSLLLFLLAIAMPGVYYHLPLVA